MKLQINGEERDFSDSPTPFTLAASWKSLGMKSDRVAVELNRDIVPRDRWSETQLNEGDKLEVVHFVGGGLIPYSSLSSPESLLRSLRISLRSRRQSSWPRRACVDLPGTLLVTPFHRFFA